MWRLTYLRPTSPSYGKPDLWPVRPLMLMQWRMIQGKVEKLIIRTYSTLNQKKKPNSYQLLLMLSNSLLHWLYIKPTWKCEDYCAIATWQSFWVIFGDVLHLFFAILRWFLFKLAKQIPKTVGGRDSDSSYIYNYSFGHLEQKLSGSCQKVVKSLPSGNGMAIITVTASWAWCASLNVFQRR